MSAADSVGSLLAAIANLISTSLMILARCNAQQRHEDHWGPDEHEQVRALETALDEAKRDFQELAPLVNGQDYYEHDRIPQSLHELRALRDKFAALSENFNSWSRAGGPINPVWAKETTDLRRELHRAQCRAAQRIFAVDHDSGSATRCLGAFMVHRKQRSAWRSSSAGSPTSSRPSSLSSVTRRAPSQRTSEPPPARTRRSRSGSIPRREFRVQSGSHHVSLDEERPAITAARQARLQARVEELMACNRVGRFERHGECDLAFVCDFCDGYIVWEDLERMPTTRTLDDIDVQDDGIASAPPPKRHVPHPMTFSGRMPPSPPVPPRFQPHKRSETVGTNVSITSTTSRASTPAWQATGFTHTSHAEKGIVFAPVAIANHTAPPPREWVSRILCPVCDAASIGSNGNGSGRRDSTRLLGTIEDEGSEGGGSAGSGEDDAGTGGDDDLEPDRWRPEEHEHGFEDLGALQEHLEWEHAAVAGGGGLAGGGSCVVM